MKAMKLLTGLMLYMLVAGQVGDVITTLTFAHSTDPIGNRAFPGLSEGNPLLYDVVHNYHWVWLALIKAAGTLVMVGGVKLMMRREEKVFQAGALLASSLATVISWEIVIHNMRLMEAI
jgi:hypothetical protein